MQAAVRRTSAPTGATLRLCRAARGVGARLTPAARTQLRRLLLDGLGVALAGSGHPTIRLLAAQARSYGARPVSTVFGQGFAASPAEAAFVNGSAGHVLDFEPMFDPPTHAVSPVLSPLLALAAADPSPSGARLLAAFAAGVQLQASLREAARAGDARAADGRRHFPFQAAGFHPPGPVGAMGSALACALYLGLPDRQAARALGIAASRAAGLACNIGTMTKATHCGHAARVGLESAQLAARGFTASDDALGAPSGWGQAFGGVGFDPERAVADMRAPVCFTRPGFAFKRWPAHTAMQVVIAGALSLHRPDRTPRTLHLRTPALPYCDRPRPASADAARFSFQYAAAVALLDGRVGLDSFTAERLADPTLQALLERIRITLDPSIPAAFPQTRIHLTLDDGRSFCSDRWPGHWKQPIDDRALRDKFRACAGPLLAADVALSLIDKLETPGALDGLLALLASGEVAP